MNLSCKKGEALDVSQALIKKGHKALAYPSVIRKESNMVENYKPVLDVGLLSDRKARAGALLKNLVAQFKDTGKKIDNGWDFTIVEFEESLSELVNSSDKTSDLINQGNHNLCGPAAFLYFVIREEPDKFAEYAISLFERFQGNIGGMFIEPDRDLVDQYYDTNWGIEKYLNTRLNNQVDWMTMSALRDDSNSFFDYEGLESDAVSGITFAGDIEKWMRGWGAYKTVLNDTNLINSKPIEHLVLSNPNGKRDICLLIDGSIMGADVGKLGKGKPNHWINLLSVNKISDTRTKIKYFTWGNITEKEFDNTILSSAYFGYVVGERSNTV